MRNTLALLAMALIYALSSEMDYNDAELISAHSREILADAACQAAAGGCDTAVDGYLALNGH
jgi:hypothetical protein